MNFMDWIVVIVGLTLVVYFWVDRICKCVEYCALARAYGRFTEAGIKVKMNDIGATLDKIK